MKATLEKIKHYAEGTLFLLRFDGNGDGNPEIGSLRLARKWDGELRSAPLSRDEYQRSSFRPAAIGDPNQWTTLLRGDLHTVVQTFPPDEVWDARVPTGVYAGLVVRAKSLHDTVANHSITFVLNEVANGFARIEGGGAYRIEDYTWEVDVNSRKPTPTESIRAQYIQAMRESIQPYATVINIEEFVDGFIARYTEALNEERRLVPADNPDREIDPDFG